jgi:glucose/arabinose dehydrogenase
MTANQVLARLHGQFVLLISVFLFACNGNENPAPQSTAQPSKTSPDSAAIVPNIQLPAGFKLSIFAQVPGARSMCLSDKGTLFVGTMSGKVYAVKDADGNGVADKVYTIASELNSPNGVAFKDGNLYVAEINRILRFDGIETQLDHPPAYKVIYDQLPKDKHHGWKFIAFGPDGKLYVPVGAPCNVCDEKNPVYASICRMNPDGTGFEIFAKGIRNTVGFAWNPTTKDIWFTDNGRDNLGDDQPNDELNFAPRKGMHFGFPYCHQGDILDPEFGKGKNCADYTAPAQKMGPHVAALGIRFYNGNMFPPEYRNQIFIAQHGSWNRTKPIGYRIMTAKLDKNKVVQYSVFASGWLGSDGKVSGRPVDVQVAPDGALLASDDNKGVVYRITYSK